MASHLMARSNNTDASLMQKEVNLMCIRSNEFSGWSVHVSSSSKSPVEKKTLSQTYAGWMGDKSTPWTCVFPNFWATGIHCQSAGRHCCCSSSFSSFFCPGAAGARGKFNVILSNTCSAGRVPDLRNDTGLGLPRTWFERPNSRRVGTWPRSTQCTMPQRNAQQTRPLPGASPSPALVREKAQAKEGKKQKQAGKRHTYSPWPTRLCRYLSRRKPEVSPSCSILRRVHVGVSAPGVKPPPPKPGPPPWWRA